MSILLDASHIHLTYSQRIVCSIVYSIIRVMYSRSRQAGSAPEHNPINVCYTRRVIILSLHRISCARVIYGFYVASHDAHIVLTIL